MVTKDLVQKFGHPYGTPYLEGDVVVHKGESYKFGYYSAVDGMCVIFEMEDENEGHAVKVADIKPIWWTGVDMCV